MSRSPIVFMSKRPAFLMVIATSTCLCMCFDQWYMQKNASYFSMMLYLPTLRSQVVLFPTTLMCTIRLTPHAKLSTFHAIRFHGFFVFLFFLMIMFNIRLDRRDYNFYDLVLAQYNKHG
jgi:hypothetical protein